MAVVATLCVVLGLLLLLAVFGLGFLFAALVESLDFCGGPGEERDAG